MIVLKARYRSGYDGRKHLFPEERNREIEVRRRHHHAWPESDPVEEGTIATGDSRINVRSQFALGHVLEFEHIDEIHARCDPAGWLADQLGRVIRGQLRSGYERSETAQP